MFWLKVASIQGFVLVVLGAFGGHIFKKALSPASYEYYDLAVRYGFYHLSALILVGLLGLMGQPYNPGKLSLLHWAGVFFLAGTIVFGGSLIALSLTDQKWLGLFTPLGGIGLLTGWIILFWYVWR